MQQHVSQNQIRNPARVFLIVINISKVAYAGQLMLMQYMIIAVYCQFVQIKFEFSVSFFKLTPFPREMK